MYIWRPKRKKKGSLAERYSTFLGLVQIIELIFPTYLGFTPSKKQQPQCGQPGWHLHRRSPGIFRRHWKSQMWIFHSSGCCSCFHGSVLPSSTPAADPTLGNGNCGCSPQPPRQHPCMPYSHPIPAFFFPKPINSYKGSKGERVINTDGKSLNCQIPPRAISAATEIVLLLLRALYFCDTGNLMAN